jgi:hypothetical protein
MTHCFEQRLVRARRDRRCSECGDTIVRGQPYVRSAGVFDGGWWHTAHCRTCDAILVLLSEDVGDDVWTRGGLVQYAHEHQADADWMPRLVRALHTRTKELSNP